MAGTLFQDNLSPYLTVVEQSSTPANPGAGDQKLFVRTSDHLLCYVNSSGTVTPVGNGIVDHGSFTYLDATDQGSDPASPSAGAHRFYAKAGGLYVRDSGGTVTGPFGTGGAGGVTQAFAGYNTAGGSWDTPGVNDKMYFKQITLANDCEITSIGAYLQSAAGNSKGPAAGVYTDSAGTPANFIGGIGFQPVLALAGGARWVDIPIGIWVAAGTYWIVVQTSHTGGAVLQQLAYDGSGSDKTANGLGEAFYDWSQYATTATTTNKFSIRANTIR